MAWRGRARLWLRSVFRRSEVEKELTEEFQFHLERQIQENLRRGLDRSAARLEALRALGCAEQQKELCRDIRGTSAIENGLRDLRYTLRTLGRNRGFCAVVILSLALGIGANTAIFSLVDALVLRPLPYPEPDRLAALSETNRGNEELMASRPDFVDWRNRSQSFGNMAAIQAGSMTLTGSGRAERLVGRNVSASFFEILGAKPFIGRDFRPGDDRPGAAATAILSYPLWQRYFGGDPGVLGRAIDLDGRVCRVIGVLPASFRFRYGGDIYLPLGLGNYAPEDRVNRYGTLVVGRLKQGVSMAMARNEMDTLASGLQKAYPVSNSGITVVVRPLSELVAGPIKGTALATWLAAALLLLMVCANIANLQLAKAAGRKRELGIRVALGANRGHLLRQALLESGVLVLCGTIAGCGLAYASLPALTHLLPFDIRRYVEVGMSVRALEFTALAAMVTTVVTGIVPGLSISMNASEGLLRSGTRTASGGFRGFSLRGSLITIEISVAMVLLVGSGLLIKSLMRLENVDPGFRANRLLTMRLTLPADRYNTKKAQVAVFDKLLGRINQIPGVISASGSTCLPLAGKGCWTSTFQIEGQPMAASVDLPSVQRNSIGVDYLAAMGIPLLRGRNFTSRDDVGRDPVVLVNQRFAEKYFARQDPIGKRISLGPAQDRGPLATIIGVMGNVRREQLDEAAPPEIAEAVRQRGSTFLQLAVRTRSGNQNEVAAAIETAAAGIDANIPVFDVRTMDWYVDNETTGRRLPALLTAVFGAAALLLASIGLYGLLAFLVARRTQEIGIRMALGATAADVLRVVMWEGLRLAITGLLIGLSVALALSRAIERLLFATSGTDIGTLVCGSGLLLAVAVIACLIPAHRAAGLDPMPALRME